MLNFIALSIYGAVCIAALLAGWNQREKFAGIATEKSASTIGADTSFSRVAGIAGAIMLTAFLMIFGGFIILNFDGTSDGANIGKWFESIKGYLIFSASLFAPYAANQISKLFGSLGGGQPSAGRADPSNQAGQPLGPRYNPNKT